MSNSRDQVQMFDLLDEALDTFGGDVSRWPDGVREKLQPLIDSEAEARRRLAEARSFDTLLGHAPVISAARQSTLVNEIVAKAQRQPRMVAATDAPPPRRVETPWRQNSWAAGALAASLMLGLLAGQVPYVNSLSEMVFADDASPQQVAQSLDVDSLWDEDLL